MSAQGREEFDGNATDHASACQRVAALFGERWLRCYVASKLRSDPVFPAAYEILRRSTRPLLDVGCGVGLLGFYLRERGLQQAISGVDIDRRKIARGREAALRSGRAIAFLESDASAALPADLLGDIAVLDLLHYLQPDRQRTLLAQLATRIAPGGTLLLRDCPRDGSARFWATYAAEKFAQTISWNWKTPLHFIDAGSIEDAFNSAEFSCAQRPAWGGTPFNNQLFIIRRHSSAVVPARE